ncbi:MAG: heme o synthase [Chlamydiales bacterium]
MSELPRLINGITSYLSLTKPGILMGNLITAAAGFALISRESWDVPLLTAMLSGLALVMASGCAFNNYLDRRADEKMSRTKNRPLATGSIPLRHALLFATILCCAGACTLLFYTNILTTVIALAGFFVYVALYTIWKYRTVHATLIGSIAGATPPVVGYCAVSHSLDLPSLILFVTLVLWQMPHFFAIAIFRLDDYAAASIPVLPLKRGFHATKIQMLLYTIAFIIVALSLFFFGYAGYGYMTTLIVLGGAWLILTIQGFKVENHKQWARKMFLFSLAIITSLSFMIILRL